MRVEVWIREDTDITNLEQQCGMTDIGDLHMSLSVALAASLLRGYRYAAHDGSQGGLRDAAFLYQRQT